MTRNLFLFSILCFFLIFSFQTPAAESNWSAILNQFVKDPNPSDIQPLTKTSGAPLLKNSEIGAGLKEALRIGTEHVVQHLGKVDGFNLDPQVHISLPGTLKKIHAALSQVGMGSLTQDLELRMNRAAEMATPKAKALFLKSIRQMTLKDAKIILTGPDDAATQYLRRTMGPELSQDIQPIVHKALSQAGAFQAYDRVMGQYTQLPFMPDVKTNMNDYVVRKALDGIFYYVAQEEVAIRKDPVKQTTALLRRVFGTIS